MKTLGNIIWFLFGGIEWAIALFFTGIIFCLTIIGIPVGLQILKMAKFVMWPFGKKVVDGSPASGLKKVINFIWAVLFGWEFALSFFITGILYCITIIGIPFGKQYFKLALFILLPLGHDFVDAKYVKEEPVQAA